MQGKLPERKRTRLKNFDYSSNGYYHITICTHENQPLLSRITVGRGLAPAETNLTSIGKRCEEQLLALQDRFPSITIDKHTIMPTHIHAIIVLQNAPAGASPRPTLSGIVCAFKSLTTRECNRLENMQGRKIFQSSFYDEIIKNEKAYQEIWQYIEENPARWAEDRYFTGE